jgi:plastocyanin
VLLALLASACAAPRPTTHAVAIQGFRFAPDTVTVSAGDTVVWTNHDVVPHTATAAEGAWDTGKIDATGSGHWVAGAAGTHRYVCAYHPTMQAVVVVR